MASTVERVIAEKLELAAHKADCEMVLRQGAIWKGVNLSPSCLYISDVTRQIYQTCIEGIRLRANDAIETIKDVLTSMNQSVSPSLKERLYALCDQHLPDGLYVDQIEKCPGVYERVGAPNKFDENVFQIASAACRAEVMNLVRTERQRVRLEIDQLALTLQKAPLWKSFYESHGKQIINGFIVAALISLFSAALVSLFSMFFG